MFHHAQCHTAENTFDRSSRTSTGPIAKRCVSAPARNSSMRVVIPDNDGPDSFSDNVASVLRDMGHEIFMPMPAKGRFRNLRFRVERLRAKVGHSFLTERDRWLVQTVRAVKADMLLALTQQVSDEALGEARARGVQWRVAWWGDAPANFTELGLLSREWDLICAKDGAAVAKFRRVGRHPGRGNAPRTGGAAGRPGPRPPSGWWSGSPVRGRPPSAGAGS